MRRRLQEKVEGWSLRFRIGLIFAGLGAGASLGAVGAVVYGWRRYGVDDPTTGFTIAALMAMFVVIALVAWVWRLFDEHVAAPIQRLASDMRAQAHAGVETDVDQRAARYLGDLAPALKAVVADHSELRRGARDALARETERLEAEAQRLASILWETPTVVLVCTPKHRLALYNKQAKAAFDDDEALGLGRDIHDLLETNAVDESYASLRARADAEGDAAELVCQIRATGRPMQGRMRLIEDATEADPGYLLTLHPITDSAPQIRAAPKRSAFYDFALIGSTADAADDPRLAEMRFVVFDTETTGLDPSRDEIVQIAAVRIVGGRVLLDETFETYVDPERGIPQTSTAIHGVDASHVRGAPKIDQAGRRFLRFAGDAALIAHNAPFDLSFFRKHADRIGARVEQPVLDTALMSTLLWPPSAGHTLDALADRLNVEIPAEARHTALGDALATAEVAVRLFPMLEAAGFGGLRALQAAPTPKALTNS